MDLIKEIFISLGIDPNREVSKLFRNEKSPEDSNLVKKFQEDVIKRTNFIELITKRGFLKDNISNFNVIEIGGGVCSTGAAFAKKCSTVISFELEKVHCLYAKRCKEHFNIHNLGIFYGSITDVDNNIVYSVKDNSVDLIISHMGMFRFTMLDTLEKANSIVRQGGTLICVYPRFWINTEGLNDIDRKLLSRDVNKNNSWAGFKSDLEMKIRDLGLKIEYNDVLEGYNVIPIGGDVILGSNIASSWNEYIENPIAGITFGKTPITCNTLICTK